MEVFLLRTTRNFLLNFSYTEIAFAFLNPNILVLSVA